MKLIINENQFNTIKKYVISEQNDNIRSFENDNNTDLNVRDLFRKYNNELQPEFNDEDSFERRKELIDGLYKSLELIGDGEITKKSSYDFDGDRLMYKELFKNNSLILVVHAAFTKHPHGGARHYRYEIGVYKNDPRTQQIGGGYGTAGIMSIKHTNLLSSIDNFTYNKNVISKVCNVIKKYMI